MAQAYWKIAAIVAIVIFLILFATVLSGFWHDLSVSVNASISSSSNLSNYPGSQGFVLGFPLWVYFIPVIGGGIAVVGVLIRARMGK